jgi:2-polyprenyl-3-methyl-5-hydroxy-6-metoxy-1,4-benzoquinol methylase
MFQEPEAYLLNISVNNLIRRRSMFRDKEILESFEKVVATFPPNVVERGINRNWRHYLFLLKSLQSFWNVLPPGGSVCDIGAGAAVVPLVLAQLGFQVNLVDQWAEYSSEQNNQMGATGDFYVRFNQFGARYYNCDLLKERIALPDASQDMVSAFAVLEHLPRPRVLLDEVSRLLKPGAFAVITVPNAANLRNRIRLMFGHSPHPDHWKVFYGRDFFGHYREPTGSELREIFEDRGFEVLHFETSNSSQVNTRQGDGTWRRGWKPTSLNQLIRGLYLLLVAFHPGFRYDLLLVARKPKL